MSNNKNCEVLNDVTAKLIDSCKGYQMCAEVSDENMALKNQFTQRQSARSQLVQEFQSKIASEGGKYEDSGTMTGSLHRGYTKFISVFKDDEKAALDALDTGEEHLAEYIQKQLKEPGLSLDATQLLNKAHASALAGERFADMLDD